MTQKHGSMDFLQPQNQKQSLVGALGRPLIAQWGPLFHPSWVLSDDRIDMGADGSWWSAKFNNESQELHC